MKLKKSIQYQKNYHRFEIECKNKEKIWLFNSSDWHFDNPKCDRKRLFKDLNEAKEKDALIVITGDLLCLMQGKYDPRRSKSSIRPEHYGDNYIDLVIEDTAEKLRPYAKNILLISEGNHETSVSKRLEADILTRLVERINVLEGTSIKKGAYTGYYTLCFKRATSKRSLHIGYSHGHWGGIISKGTQGVPRYASFMPDCDIMFTGHTHDKWIVTHPRLVREDKKHKVRIKEQYHVKTGTYKEEYGEGSGWAAERIGMPKAIGGCFTEVTFDNKKDLEYRFMLT